MASYYATSEIPSGTEEWLLEPFQVSNKLTTPFRTFSKFIIFDSFLTLELQPMLGQCPPSNFKTAG